MPKITRTIIKNKDNKMKSHQNYRDKIWKYEKSSGQNRFL